MFAEFALEIGEIIQVVGRFARLRRRQRPQRRLIGDQAGDHMEVIFHVRNEVQSAARLQNARALGGESAVKRRRF